MNDLKSFTKTVREVLLQKPPRRAQYENRKPTPEELRRRFRLVQKHR